MEDAPHERRREHPGADGPEARRAQVAQRGVLPLHQRRGLAAEGRRADERQLGLDVPERPLERGNQRTAAEDPPPPPEHRKPAVDEQVGDPQTPDGDGHDAGPQLRQDALGGVAQRADRPGGLEPHDERHGPSAGEQRKDEEAAWYQPSHGTTNDIASARKRQRGWGAEARAATRAQPLTHKG